MISEKAVEICVKNLTSKCSFAVRTTRTGNHSFSSQDVSVLVGDKIVRATGAKVDLTSPDFELFIEVREDKSFIFTEKIVGPGGLPLGTQGNVVGLVENSVSLLAVWYLLRRGCNVVIVKAAGDLVVDVESFLKNWYANSKIHSINMDVESFFEKLQKIAFGNNCDAVVTGHHLDENVSVSYTHLRAHET